MKRKFETHHYVGTALVAVAVAAGSIPVVGQSPSQNLPLSNLPYSSSVPAAQEFPSMPQQALKSTRSTKSPLFRFNTDGTIERVEKEPGVPFSPEEVQQSMDARQRLQNTVSLMKAPDADEAKKEDAKQLIANYLKAEFQWDQEARREQLDRLEKQIDLLKKQLTKREESQEKLIELRLQLLENDASGLSFPEAWANLSDGQSHWPTTGPNASGPPPSSPYPSPNVYGNGMIYRPSQNPNYPNPPIYSNPPAFPNKYPKQLPAPSAKP